MKIIAALFLSLFLFTEAYSQNGFWVDYTKAPSPFMRGAFATSLIGDKQILLFGGRADKDYFSDETWLFDFKTLSWSQLLPLNKPEGRHSHGMCQLTSNLVLMFGGLTDSGKVLNDTWLFDLSNTSWIRINTDNPPQPRYNFGLCEIETKENRNNALLFGGNSSGSLLFQDTWVFDSKLMNWKKVLVKTDGGNIPRGRAMLSLVPIDENRVFLLGGQEWEGYFRDIWEFNTDKIDSSENTVKWKKINTKHDIYFPCRTQKLKPNVLILSSGIYTKFYFIDEDSLVIRDSLLNDDDPGTTEGLTRIDDGIIFLHGGNTSSLPNGHTWIYYDDESLVSVEGETSNKEIVVHPNPASDFIEIILDGNIFTNKLDNSSYDIRIVNVLGVEVLKYMDSRLRGNDNSSVRIDISQLKKGVYFVQIGGKTAKFIKL